MRGEFVGVWPETWREIWHPLIEEALNDNEELVSEDMFCELYRELAGSPKRPGALKTTPSIEALADTLANPARGCEAFQRTRPEDLAGERQLVAFFEAARDALEEFGGEALGNRYFNLLSAFIDKFSLRYDLRRPCVLCPTLPGVFASLVRDLRALAARDPQLDPLMKDYEESIRDLRFGGTDGRIKTCIAKQFMLLEALGALAPGVTKGTLGDMCDQVGSWPHATIRESLKKLYGFASDYPGIRHGKNAKGALRTIDLRDMVAMSILLTGYTPYLEGRLSADAIYGGSTAKAAAPSALQAATVVASHSALQQGEMRRFVGKLRRFWLRMG